jgi:hypothetical protein
MEKCIYCEDGHPHMTPEEAAEIEREILSDHIPDLDKVVHDTVRLVAEVRRLRKDLGYPE